MRVRDILNSLGRDDLKRLCRRRGLPVADRTRRLRERLARSYSGRFDIVINDLRWRDLHKIGRSLSEQLNLPPNWREFNVEELRRAFMVAIAGMASLPLEMLPATLLGGFRLVPRVRNALLELGEDVLLADVRKYLNGAGGPASLVSVAGTDYERDSLSDGYSRFISAAKDGRRPLGGQRSENQLWIIADSQLTPKMKVNPRTVDKIAELELDAQLGDDYQSWLPWMSLEMVNLLGRWQQPRIATIERAMFTLSARLSAGSAAVHHPWVAGYAKWKRQLPIQVLYCQRPSRSLDDALAELSRLGLTSINDLRCWHPEAVSASKAEERPLFVLRKVLEDLSG